ncbi:hypothetical protein CIT292_06599 [Citrobacter youngae ATCC 29220]|uniref:Uncharacterized protein n=1 Tax=Citrobacter youngae ATCC 29220 TaxID=500640 RepID=D4B7S4_9ENTR|nr:hypothetical protein CIT292_06599 [Citrobacter youngae ATCC 29220]
MYVFDKIIHYINQYLSISYGFLVSIAVVYFITTDYLLFNCA